MDAQEFDWNLFEEDFLQWHYASQPDDQPLENNTLFGEDSDQEPTPKKTGSKISRASSKRSNVSSPSSETGDSSSKKTSSAYIKRRCQNRAAQRAFRARQKDHMGALEQKLQSMLAEYDNLQQKYTSLSIAYDALVNGKGAQENRDGSSYMSMLSNGWNFTEVGSLEEEKQGELEEERSRFLAGSFRYR